MTIDTGGQAFPVQQQRDSDGSILTLAYEGMTLRDYFAARAMRIMWDAYDKEYLVKRSFDESGAHVVADGAYRMADAMLKARNK